MSPRKPKHLRLFFVECGGPLDAIESRSESAAVGGMARLIGHSVLTFNTYSKRALEEACAYIGSICDIHDPTPHAPMCLHISSHGSAEGLAFGADTIAWTELLQVIQPVLTKNYQGDRILVISACEANEQTLSKAITDESKKRRVVPPQYIFCATGRVAWDDAAVGWTLLYHLIPSVNLDEKSEVQNILKKIAAVGLEIVYSRWDAKQKKYMRFGGSKLK